MAKYLHPVLDFRSAFLSRRTRLLVCPCGRLPGAQILLYVALSSWAAQSSVALSSCHVGELSCTACGVDSNETSCRSGLLLHLLPLFPLGLAVKAVVAWASRPRALSMHRWLASSLWCCRKELITSHRCLQVRFRDPSLALRTEAISTLMSGQSLTRLNSQSKMSCSSFISS